MRVVVNQLAALGTKTGIGHYAGQLLRCLRQQSAGTIDAFPPDWLRPARLGYERTRAYLDPESQQAPPRLRNWLRAQALQVLRRWGRTVIAHYFRLFCARRHYQLYHEPNFIPLPSDLPTVATLHDLSVLRHPEWHPADRVAYYEKHFHKGLTRCQHFLAISEFGRQEIVQMLQIPPERITRTYMGIRPGLGPLPPAQVSQVLRQLGLPSRYLLYLGTIEPRKNVRRLLEAYCSLPRKVRSRWPLLLVGGWGWNTQQVAEYLHNEARHRGVIHVGYVPEKHLPAIYNGARALVYPSLYEGFGLPPVEMLACGGAVLASTAGALVETVGGQAHLIQPEDLGGWHDAMARVVEDDDWWQFLRDGGEQVGQQFTWERCAADTLQVYQKLCGTTDQPDRTYQTAA